MNIFLLNIQKELLVFDDKMIVIFEPRLFLYLIIEGLSFLLGCD